MTTTTKKTPFKLILFIALGLAGLCVVCVVAAFIFQATPEGKAAATESAAQKQADTAQPTAIANVAATATEPKPMPTQKATNTPKPTKTSAPTATNTPVPEPIVYTGSGDKIIDLEANFPIAIIKGAYQGGSNFSIISYDKDNEYIDLLVNTIGQYEGTRPFNFGDEKAKRLEVTASGPWTITIYPIALDYIHVCEVPGPCTGTSDDVVLLRGSEPDKASIKYVGDSNFAVIGWGEDHDLMVNEIGNYEGEVLISPSTMILEISSSGEWTIDISGR